MQLCKLSDAASSPGLPFCSFSLLPNFVLCFCGQWWLKIAAFSYIATHVYLHCNLKSILCVIRHMFITDSKHVFLPPPCARMSMIWEFPDPRFILALMWPPHTPPHGWIFRFCNACGVRRSNKQNQQSLSVVVFIPGPSSSGPAGKEARGRLTVASGAQPGPQPAALTPSTLVTAGWQHTHCPKVDASSSCRK